MHSEERRQNNISIRKRYINEHQLVNQNDEILLNKKNYTDKDFIDDEQSSDSTGFVESIKIVQKLFMNCKRKNKSSNEKENFILALQSCVQVSVLRALDRMLKSEVIPLNDDVFLVRDQKYIPVKNNSQIW